MTNAWKISRYVTRVYLNEADTLLLYSGLTGQLVQVQGSHRSRAEAVLAEPNTTPITCNDKLFQLFQQQGILVPGDVDEVAVLKQRYEQSRCAVSGVFGLTICPTLNCNFRCTYCYQHHPSGIMSEAIQDKVIQMVQERYPPVTNLTVTWFGGESLLALPVIERLSTKFIEHAQSRYRYTAKIVTNGWRLTPDVSQRLADLHVQSAQITLDGPRELHDVRRPLANGRSTFDRIVKNLASADSRLRLILRVNVDRTNSERVPQLFDELDAAGLKGRVSVYFAAVIAYTDVCADVAADCVAGQSWSKYQAQLQLTALQRGYGGANLPRPKGHACIADGQQGFVITPSGLGFKCWNEVTQPDKAIFDLTSDQYSATMQRNLDAWTNWRPFQSSVCTNCHVLPLCMGGCPYMSIRSYGLRNPAACKELKYNLAEQIANYYLRYRRKREAKQLLTRLGAWLPRETKQQIGFTDDDSIKVMRE